MTNEHDEALVERVALAIANAERAAEDKQPIAAFKSETFRDYWRDKARAVIYPPAPPKTRLEVARELLAAEQEGTHDDPSDVLAGDWDDDPAMLAIIAALALPAMEDNA